MSISKFQDSVNKTGCAKVVLFSGAVVMVAGMFYQGCQSRGMADKENRNGEDTALSVGKIDVPEKELQAMIQMSMKEAVDQRQLGPSAEAGAYQKALNQAVGGACLQILADEKRVSTDEKSLLLVAEGELDKRIEGMRTQLVGPTGSDKEFMEKFKTTFKKTPAELKKAQLDSVKQNLGDKAKHDDQVKGLLLPAVTAWYKSKVDASEATVKASYDTLTLQRVYLGPQDKEGPAALGDIKNGKAFTDVMTRYSKDPAEPKKKVSDGTVTMTRKQLNSEPTFAPLKTLKNGETTQVIKVSDGYAIYKLIGIKSDVPATFEKDKKKLIDTYADGEAQAKMDADFKALKSSAKIKWASAGNAIMWEVSDAFGGSNSLDPTKLTDKLRSLFTKAKELSEKSPSESHAAKLAAYLAIDTASNFAMDKKPLQKDLIWAIEAIISENDTVADRLRLVDLYVEAKDGAKAAQNLTEALRVNGQYDNEGQKNFGDIAAKAISVEKAGLLSAADKKTFQEEQQRWRDAKRDEDKMAAESKKAEEEERKRQEAESKKVGTVPPPTTTPAPGATTPPLKRPAPGTAPKK